MVVVQQADQNTDAPNASNPGTADIIFTDRPTPSRQKKASVCHSEQLTQKNRGIVKHVSACFLPY